MVRTDPPISEKSAKHCCEDHFNVEEDTQNYMQYKIMQDIGGDKVNLRLKKGILPHIFKCQNRSKTMPERTVVLKRRKLELLQEEMAPYIGPAPLATKDEIVRMTEKNDHVVIESKSCDKSIQVNLRPKYRSKCISTMPQRISVALSPFKKPTLEAASSPFKVTKLQNVKRKLFSSSSSDKVSVKSTSLFTVTSMDYETETTYSDFSFRQDKDIEFKNKTRSIILETIEREPKLLLGLPKKCYYLIKLLSDNLAIPTIDILITLKKIKLNESFSVLALQFGYTQSTISRIFRKTITLLAHGLKQLIIWPDVKRVISHLPIAFRARYSKVYSIIDCLEIEIEKPTNALHQSLTWSQYKGCNTSKYLISCTPDGLITFISEGYGGRVSDATIVENSGFLDRLPPHTAVMADRGFKNIAHLLQKKNCTLIRPPSVSKSSQSTREEVLLSKRIAALRIHVERVIGRIREFKLLLLHSRINSHLVPLLDHIIVSACGIINMQDFLIKV